MSWSHSSLIISGMLMMLPLCLSEHFTNTWAVHVKGGEGVARQLAEKHGFVFLDTIMPDYYHFQHRHVSKRSITSSHHQHSHLAQEPDVLWVEQQVSKKRVKRDTAMSMFTDPMWPRMWYLHRDGGLDMNVVDVYQRFGITGRGTVVSILDDGIEKDHPDLMKNYDAAASYDVNDHDNDPQPRYDYSNENRHGTRCAGEVAAQANNNLCNVGVAYDAGIGGVRMLDGDVTDAVEAQSIGLNPHHIDIYSASWGPDDDGRTVDGPGPLARKAFFDGINVGRKGLGSIYVWASGNGGQKGDSCGCDGYTNSIYTLSISSASENGLVPWYSESCASTLATTYSSGSPTERQILTTDLRHLCTDTHTGTSASAPLAAGICALALQANPSLTWRDMQYLVVLTARQANLQADDWVVNGIGRKVSHHYGFGLMNAAAMVDLALNWTRLPEQQRCQILSQDSPRSLPANSRTESSIETTGCEGTPDVVRSLEHVQVSVTLGATRRGEVEIYLTSPRGTRSVLLPRRSADTSDEGLSNWIMMTTHSWGEQPAGTWTLTVATGATGATLSSWSLILYGTEAAPKVLVDYLRHQTTQPSPTQSQQANSSPLETSPKLVSPTAERSSVGLSSLSAQQTSSSSSSSFETSINRVPLSTQQQQPQQQQQQQQQPDSGISTDYESTLYVFGGGARPSTSASYYETTLDQTPSEMFRTDEASSVPVTKATSLALLTSASNTLPPAGGVVGRPTSPTVTISSAVASSGSTHPVSAIRHVASDNATQLNKGAVACDRGLVLLDGQCISKCQAGYYLSNRTVVHANSTSGEVSRIQSVILVCLPCSSWSLCNIGVGSGGARWRLVVIVASSLGVVIVAVVACVLCRYVRCNRTHQRYEQLRLYKPDNNHVDLSGFAQRHLLASESDSESASEDGGPDAVTVGSDFPSEKQAAI